MVNRNNTKVMAATTWEVLNLKPEDSRIMVAAATLRLQAKDSEQLRLQCQQRKAKEDINPMDKDIRHKWAMARHRRP